MTHRKATRLPEHRGPAAWAEILGAGPTFPPVATDRTADVVIIGAGFAGLSAARRLSQIDPALDVVVLDAGQIAEGAAGRNSGFMIDIPHDLTSDDYKGAGDDRRLIGLNRQAQSFGAQAVKDYGISPDFFDRAGKINGAASTKANACNLALSRHLSDLGEPYELLDADQMAERTGTRYYHSGLFTPGTVMLQPAGYVRGLAQGLSRAGVAIHERSPALRFERTGQRWTVTTPGGRISTARIILTANGHLASFGFARDRLMQLFLFAVMTPELTIDQLGQLGGQSRWGVTPSDPMGTTVRRIDTAQGGNRIVTRTCAVLRPDMAAKPRDLTRAARIMQAKFDARFIGLTGMKMEYSWAGHLCFSLNGVSVAREIEQGVFSGCVQNGLGTARGTLTGIAAAETAMGETSEITEFFGEQQAPKTLPPQPFRQIGANVLLRLKEWRARLE